MNSKSQSDMASKSYYGGDQHVNILIRDRRMFLIHGVYKKLDNFNILPFMIYGT